MNKSSKTAFLAIGLTSLAVVISPMVQGAVAASISEPHTIFYGKVLGTGSEQEFLITSGHLQWKILRADGVEIELETSLFDLNDGTYSYRLHVPHSAFALGLETGTAGILLPPMPAVNLHSEVTVDGETAALMGPASVVFTTEQLLRTATYRMDLALGREALDTDGDGIPDWWEDLYGLDKQDPSDAGLDLNGDGLTALDAYLQGLDPNRDARAPSVLTDELVVYPGGSTALLLETVDLDSTPDQVVYTLSGLPAAGNLVRRNAQADPQSPDAELTVDDQFTQADLLSGRVLYVHDGSTADPGLFTVSVQDEDPAHSAAEGAVRLLTYHAPDLLPPTLGLPESRWLENHYYGMADYVILDASDLTEIPTLSTPSAGLAGDSLAAYLAAYGNDRPYVLVGGANGMILSGGHRDDVLTAAANGGSLIGGAGADLFTFENLTHGRTVIADFSTAEYDTIDLSNLPGAPGASVQSVLRLVEVEGTVELQVALDQAHFTNLVVALPGLPDVEADLYALIDSDRLLVGSLTLEPRISVTATAPRAAQNGPTAGRFTLGREGNLDSDLQVNIQLSGTAVNGSDYELVSSVVTMPAGISQVDIDIMPYMTGYQGPDKVAQLTLLAGSGYSLGTQQNDKVTIANLAMVAELDVIENPAIVDSGTPAIIRLRRRYVTTDEVLFRLRFGGTAISGTDYESLPTLVTMPAGQTAMLLEIKPKPGAAWAGGARTVSVSLVADPEYIIEPTAGTAQVSLIQQVDTLSDWRLREFGESAADLTAFAAADSGGFGISHLQRYAFGLDPQAPDRDGMPQAMLDNGRRLVTFRKPLSVQEDLVYRVSAMTDLMNPEQAAVTVVPVAAPAGSTDPERVYYEAAAPADSPVFIVVEVEWLP